MPHAIIIGGGPAGSVGAIFLARAGWRVTLVEQARFPRHKVCGECLSALGQDVLARHDLIAPLRAVGVPLVRAMLHATDGTSREFALPRPMLGISRATLDDLLLNAALNAGATIYQPARVLSLAPSPGEVTCEIRSLTEQTSQTISADIALLADGKSALLDPRPPATGDFGIKTHLIDVHGPADAIELFGVNGHYGGLSPVEGGRFNTSFSVPADRLATCNGDLDRLFARIVIENPVLSRRLKHAQRVGEWHASPLPRFGVRTDWPANVIPLGNAAGAIEPIGGEGMGLAVRSAELAAEALTAGTVADLPAKFRQLWTVRRFACRAAAKVMSSPAWSSRVLSFVGQDDPLTNAVLGWIGKT